jgi:hypothetical protein
MQKQIIFMPGLVLVLAIFLLNTAGVFAQELTCTECHNDTTIITGKQTAWSESMHGSGGAYERGTSASCAGCHSGGAFSKRVVAGLQPDELEQGDPNPTRQDCRTCHQIHTSYTSMDWALETTVPVELYALEGVTYDGGKGNLCANCHQPRRSIDQYMDPNDGTIEVDSSHWGPHHGPQSALLVGKGGAGDVAGFPSPHSVLVQDTCVSCHIGENNSHTFEPVIETCTNCHGDDIEDFDIDGLQTEIKALIEEVRDLLIAKGLLTVEIEYEIGDNGIIESVAVGYEPVEGIYPAAEASALWNFILIAIEDGSLGVHNPRYTKDMLEAARDALQ